MENEFFEPWYHGLILNDTKVAFDKVVYSGSGMEICLQEIEGIKRTISFYFSESPTAVRITNESQRLVSARLIPKNNRHSFYLVKNSKFLQWMNSESLDIYKEDPLFHLAIFTDEWIDLICNDMPIISIQQT